MLEHLFQQSIGYEQKVGKNEYGKSIYASPILIEVRYEGTNKLVRKDNGEKEESQYSIFTNFPISIGDRVIIDGKSLVVLEVTAVPDPNNLEEIFFREVYA